MGQQYTLVFAPETISHLKTIDRKHYRLIQQISTEQLSITPEQETRNRKPLKQPAPYGATWELRFGPNNRFRIFYEVHQEETEVWILAIGIKQRKRLFIGGEEY